MFFFFKKTPLSDRTTSNSLGLPFCDVHLLEVNVCLNYALVILCSTSQQTLVPGGYHVSQAVLQKTLHRGLMHVFWLGYSICFEYIIMKLQVINICVLGYCQGYACYL